MSNFMAMVGIVWSVLCLAGGLYGAYGPVKFPSTKTSKQQITDILRNMGA